MISKTQTGTLAANVDVCKCFKMNYIDWKSIGCREKYRGALQRSLHNFNTCGNTWRRPGVGKSPM